MLALYSLTPLGINLNILRILQNNNSYKKKHKNLENNNQGSITNLYKLQASLCANCCTIWVQKNERQQENKNANMPMEYENMECL